MPEVKDEVKEMAAALEDEFWLNFLYDKKMQRRLELILAKVNWEALARVALEYVEERGRDNLAANIIPKLVELKRLSIALNKFVSSCAHELGEVAYPPKEDE